MKVNELVSLVNNNKNKMLKGEQLQQFLEKTLEVKKYIGIKEKRELIDNIVNNCIIYEDGILKFNEIDKYITFTMMTISAYTNLELSLDMEDDYDQLCNTKLLNAVVETFNGEYENVKLLLAMQCDYILSANNVEAQLSRMLSVMLDKIDNVSDVVIKKVDGLDVNKFKINTDGILKLIDFINSNKK